MTRISLTRKLAIVLVSLLPFGIAHADKIIIASDPWMPHTGHEEGDKGYILDLAIAILEEAGHDVEYVVRPWSRAISDTREGKLNAIAACFQEEAEDFGAEIRTSAAVEGITCMTPIAPAGLRML